VTIQDPGGPGPEVFNVVLGQAREVRSTPFGDAGTVFSGQGTEMVWVSKLAEPMPPGPDTPGRSRHGSCLPAWLKYADHPHLRR
jgi:hypothetical protein